MSGFLSIYWLEIFCDKIFRIITIKKVEKPMSRALSIYWLKIFCDEIFQIITIKKVEKPMSGLVECTGLNI